ncbi:tonb-dependent outer membrane receptor [mine drainage metagenome]|uniref:Tonb-dependent outer membrane receptor n=3 Tax=mine drainage metagenome TaxID=410659 RepID=T1D5A3_9ZZZZ
MHLARIRVSGSSLVTASARTPTPVYVIKGSALKSEGYATIGEVISRLSFDGSAAGSTSAFTNQFTNGGEANVSLHSLGHNRVLVLVNGHRWVSGLKGDVDLNSIPLALVRRIEILDANGGARYGSGAVAGVVNIITRKNYNHSTLSLQSGIYQGGGTWDGTTQGLSFTTGLTTRHSGLLFGFTYFNQAGIPAGDRTISSEPIAGTGVTRGSTATPQGTFEFTPLSGPLTASPLCPTSQGEPLCDLTHLSGTSGASLSDFAPFSNPERFNPAPFNEILMPQERTSFYIHGYRRMDSNLEGSFTAFYNRRNSSQSASPPLLILGKNGLPVNIAANQPYNPFGTALDATGPNANLVSLGRAMVEDGPLILSEQVNMLRLSAGLRGRFGSTHDSWLWSAYTSYSQNDVTDTNYGRFNLDHLENALGSPANCAQATGCVPLNLFGGPGTITPAMLHYIAFTEVNAIDNTQRVFGVNLSSPGLWNDGAGVIRVEAGYQYRDHEGISAPNPIAQAGEDSASPGIPVLPTVGSYATNSVFASANLPLLRDAPGFRNLMLDVAQRYSHYNTFGSIPLTQIALRDEIDRAWTLRAVWGQSFRTPDLHETNAALVEEPIAISDPCSNYEHSGVSAAVQTACAEAGVPTSYIQPNALVNELAGGNASLAPETAIDRTLGFVWTPPSLPLDIEADYYRITINNAIGAPGAQEILDGCYESGDPLDCSRITRAPDGTLGLVDNVDANLGGIMTDGVDALAQYHWPPLPSGSFTASLMVSWVHNYLETTSAFPTGTMTTNLVGVERGGTSFPLGVPRLKATYVLAWRRWPWLASLTFRYISPLTERCSDFLNGTPESLTNLGLCSEPDYQNNSLSQNVLGSTVYTDLQVGYALARYDTVVRIGVRNLLDRNPPVSTQQVIDSYDSSIYDIPGRFIYVNVTSQF